MPVVSGLSCLDCHGLNLLVRGLPGGVLDRTISGMESGTVGSGAWTPGPGVRAPCAPAAALWPGGGAEHGFPARSWGWGGRRLLQGARDGSSGAARGASRPCARLRQETVAAPRRRAAPLGLAGRGAVPRRLGRLGRASRPSPPVCDRHGHLPARLPRSDRGPLHLCCFCSPAGPEHPPGLSAGPSGSPGPDGLPVRRSPVRASTTPRVDPGVESAPRHPVRSARHARGRASIPTASAHAPRRASMTALLPHAPAGRASSDGCPPHAPAGRASTHGFPPHAARRASIAPFSAARPLRGVHRSKRTPRTPSRGVHRQTAVPGTPSRGVHPTGPSPRTPSGVHPFLPVGVELRVRSVPALVFRRGGLGASSCRARGPAARTGSRSFGRASFESVRRALVLVALEGAGVGLRASRCPGRVRLFVGCRACGWLAAGLRASARVRVFWLLACLAWGFLASLSPVGGPLGGGGQGDALACGLVGLDQGVMESDETY